MASSSDPTTEAKTELKDIKYDTRYYLQEDSMAIFLVEGCLFKVHRYFLVGGSEVFRDMFASPAEGVGPEGKNDEQPILLPDVTQREFQALLDYFYLPPHAHGWLHISSTKNHWQTYTDLLSISHRFIFDKVFQFALEKLGPIVGKFLENRSGIISAIICPPCPLGSII